MTCEGAVKHQRVGVGHEQRQSGLVISHFALETGLLRQRHVGRIAHDEVEGWRHALGELRAQRIGADERHIEAAGVGVAGRDGESLWRHVGGENRGIRARVGDGKRDGAAPGADIEHPGLGAVCDLEQRGFDDFFGLGPWDENAGRDL